MRRVGNSLVRLIFVFVWCLIFILFWFCFVAFLHAKEKCILSFANLLPLYVDYVNAFHRLSVASTDVRMSMYNFYLGLLCCHRSSCGSKYI